MIDFIKQNWQYFVYAFELLSVIFLTIVLSIRNKKLKLNAIAERAVEAAEQLDGTAEQKKAYASALIKQELKASDKCISCIIEKLIAFSKLVNSKNSKTIQEVLSDEFKESN